MKQQKASKHNSEGNQDDAGKKQPVKKHRFWRITNHILNVALVLIGLGWIAGWYLTPKPTELQAQATQEFARAELFFANDTLEKYNFMSSMRVATFAQLVDKSKQKPVIIMVYASWCPNCKGMFEAMNDYAKHNPSKLNLAIISVDVEPEDAEAFLAKNEPIYVESYIVDNKRKYYADIGNEMRDFGFDFTGGIFEDDAQQSRVFKQIAVPHLMIIKDGKPDFEKAGAIKQQELKQLLTKYANDVK